MNKQEAIELLDKYLEGKCTPEEYHILIRAYNMEIPAQAEEPSWEEYEASRNLILNRLQEQYPEIRPLKIRLWSRITGIAAAVAILALCIYFFKSPGESSISPGAQVLTAVQDIDPGKNTAILTLANGKIIQLSDQKNGVVIGNSLTYDDQTSVISEGELKLLNTTLTAATPRGGTYEFTLPDGTRVWLNADSKISFPYRFSGSHREISLEGEAYFEVAKDKLHPFLVETRDQQIQVLGTSFNVNSYGNEQYVATTLLEGSIKLIVGKKSRTLVPGEQAINSPDLLQVNRVNVESIMDWRSGEFYMDKVNFKVALRKLERWYDIDFIYDKSITDDMVAGGWISKSSKLSQVLRLIGKSGQVKFKIEGRTVYVTK